VQGLRHRDLPIHAVQFHPESVASEHGHRLLANFLGLAKGAKQGVDKHP
jgi:anthranilate/para-aminobenzoate synthase component II